MATIQTVIDEARVILQDSSKARYTDAELLTVANYALYSAKRVRPDLFFSSIGQDQTAVILSDTFPLPTQFQPVVSNYIVSRAELRDDEYSVDGRAAALDAAFRAALLALA